MIGRALTTMRLTLIILLAAAVGLTGCGGGGSEDQQPNPAAVIECLEDAGANVSSDESGGSTSITATFPGNSAETVIDIYDDGTVGSSIPNPTTLPESDAVHDCVPEESQGVAS